MERLLAEKGLLTDRYPTRWIALKVLENDSEILRQVERMPDVAAQLRADRETVADHLRDTLQTSPEAIIADYRYGFIRGVLRSGAVRRESAKDRLELSDKLDKVLTNTLFGPLIMLGVLYAMFQLTFVIGAYPQGWVEDGFGWLGETVSALMPDGFLKSLIVSGVIDGLGGVMSFVPLIIIMFTLVAILEDFGYMARMAYMLDRVFRAFGLTGLPSCRSSSRAVSRAAVPSPASWPPGPCAVPRKSWRPCSRFLIWRAEPNSPCFCCWWACSSPKTPPVPCSC